MTQSYEWWDFHLTTRGWSEGSSHEDRGGTIEVPIPSDRVLTVRRHARRGEDDGESQDEDALTVVWSTDDQGLLNDLVTRHGRLPPVRA